MADAVLPAPLRSAQRAVRMRAPLLTAGAVGVATIALHLRDPHTSGSWGYCPFYAMTGMYCPGCGGLRAVNDLTNLDLVGAASSNLLFVASIPLILLFWLRWARRSWKGGEVAAPAPAGTVALVTVVAVLMVVFTVLRNLPAGSWLAP